MISIALATYNGEKYFTAQMDSIMNQTIQDFEIVICDDCSTDNTWDIIEQYAAQDNRIRNYKNERNLGFLKNFEKAITLCRGEYIALSDQDDIWTPNHLEVLFENIGENSIACGDAEMVNDEGKSWGTRLSEIERTEVLPQNELDRALRLLYFGNPYQGASMLIKRKFFDYALPIPDANYHDAWFAILACFCGGLKYVDLVITHYRQHNDNVTDHDRWSVLKALLRLKPYRKTLTDRMAISKEVLNRINDLSEIERAFLNKSIKFHKRKDYFMGRLQNLPFIFNNYSRIYTTRSKSLLVPRLLKSLL